MRTEFIGAAMAANGVNGAWEKYASVRSAHYVTALTTKVAADLDISRDWKSGSLKDDGKRGFSGKSIRK